MNPADITCDAQAAGLDVTGDHLRHWGGSAPDLRIIGATNYYLTLDDEPWPIVAGEFQPQRYPRAEWAEAVRTLRAGGCTMVSSYWFWSLVEPEPGRFDFGGPNDIAAFARICADHGMLFQPRIGPFNNAEFLLGGLPPWLYGMPLVERSNDPRYLELVGRYYAAIGEQLRGQFWSSGGPVVVVQLENELSHAPNDWRTLFGYTATDHRGPGGAEFTAHMAHLRRLAVEGGIRAPIFSMTGWGTAGDPPGDDFLPTYGAYMDLHDRPGPNNTLTTFGGGPPYPYRGRLPVAFCELGTGSPARAVYRPMSPPEMMSTTALTRLGGVETIFLGYYLYHGGTNPVRGDGFSWMIKEPTFGLRSYDFWAPVSEFGERRRSFYLTTPLNLFVREFGTELATKQALPVDDPVVERTDDRLRAAVRADEHSAFVFLSNYGNRTPLPDRAPVQLTVKLADRTVQFPRHAELLVPSAANLILPANLDLGGGVTLVSATAQPLARVGTGDEQWCVFAAPTDRPVEYTLAGVTPDDVNAGTAAVHHDADAVTVVTSGDPVVITTATARRLYLATLDLTAAEHSQLIGDGADKRLLTSPDELSVTEHEVRLARFVDLGSATPPPATLRSIPPSEPGVQRVPLPAPRLRLESIAVERLSAARWLLRCTERIDDPEDLWIDLGYTGDLCRAFDAGTGQLLADDFNRGIPWRVKLGRFADAVAGAGVQFRVEPVAERMDPQATNAMLLDSKDDVHSPATIDSLRLFARVSTTVALPTSLVPGHGTA